jgi:hypothetical protein
MSTAQSLVVVTRRIQEEVVQAAQLAFAPHQTKCKVKNESFVDGSSML